jgi:hypothetical protein
MIDPKDKAPFFELMNTVAPVYNMEMSKPTVKLWWNLLIQYTLEDIAAALHEHLRTAKFAPKPAEVIALIDKMHPDGRVGVEEAWAMIPRDEYRTVVMSQEMAEALKFAQPLLNEGDQIAARMAFKEAYTHLVDENRRLGVAVKWFASLGQDPLQRDSAIKEAVRLGRLGSDHANRILIGQSTPVSQISSDRALQIEQKDVELENRAENLARIRKLIGKFNGVNYPPLERKALSGGL